MFSIPMETLEHEFCNDLLGQKYDVILKNLIEAVLDSPDSEKLSNFEELLQRRVDPPLKLSRFTQLFFIEASDPQKMNGLHLERICFSL